MDFLGAFGGNLEAVDHNVVFAALQSRYQAVPLILNKACFASHVHGDGICQIHFKADDARRISRIRKGVWRAAFGISGPDQFLRACCGWKDKSSHANENEKVRNGFHI